MLRLIACLSAVAVVAVLGAHPASARPFSSSSFWNQPLNPRAQLDPKSALYVSDLQRQVVVWGAWINTDEHSVPVYTVGPGQKTTRVTLLKWARDEQSKALAEAWEDVPLPDDAQPASGVDRTLVVHQPSSDTLWEFHRLEKVGDRWAAEWGGKITGVSGHPGHYTAPTERWGATATSLSALGGLIRIDELKSGTIDHALAIALPVTRARVFSWPAQRTDGQLPLNLAIPQGTRFRLPADLDLSEYEMTPIVRQIALAAQRYGLVVRDTSQSVAFYAEDPTPTGSDPYYGEAGFFGGSMPSSLLSQFPWRRLQALKTYLSVDPL
jgi:hypothetical protein